MLGTFLKGPIGMAVMGTVMAASTAVAGVTAGPSVAQAVSDRIHATAVPTATPDPSTPTPKPTAKPLPTATPLPHENADAASNQTADRCAAGPRASPIKCRPGRGWCTRADRRGRPAGCQA